MNAYIEHHPIRDLLAIALLLASFSVPDIASAQSDDFNDGNDNGWVRYDPLASLGLGDQATWTFTNGAYRIRATRNPAIPAQAGPARAGSYRTNVYSDFYMVADIVNWDESLDQAIGFLARISNPGLGMTVGYALTYQVPDHDIDITRFTGEGNFFSVPLSGGPSGDDITMVPGRSYRYVWIGKGPQFTVRIYEHPNLTTPILDVTGSEGTYTSGFCGFLVFDNSGTANAGIADATFDNYFAQDVEPPRLDIAPGPFEGDIIVGWLADVPTNFVLQSTTSLSPGSVWTDIPYEKIRFSMDETRREYDDNISTGPTKYYRLRRP